MTNIFFSEIKNNCQLLKAPRYGDIRCTRSRHRTQLFYRTRCSIWCNKGYKLQGHPVRNCNGTGHWDGADSICVRKFLVQNFND